MPTDPDLIAAWSTWLTAYRGRAAATSDKYTAELRRLCAWLKDQGHTLKSIDRAGLETYAGLWLHKQGLTPRARRPAVAALRGFFGWAQQAGHRVDNPAAQLRPPRTGRALPRAMSLQSAEALLMAPDLETFLGVRDAAILAVLIGCGLRLGGLVALNEGNLIWHRDHTGGERLTLRVREKGDHERLVPAPDEARLLVRAYLGHPDLEAIDRLLPNGDRVLFVSTAWQIPPHEYYGEARRLSRRAVQEMIQRYGRQLGLPREELHPHAARHLYGTELAEDDVHILISQALLGHVDPKTTQVYSHVAARRLAAIVDQSNPLGKVRTPVTALSKRLKETNRARPS